MSWPSSNPMKLDQRSAYVAAPTGDHRVVRFAVPEPGAGLEDGEGGGSRAEEGVSALYSGEEEDERRTHTGSNIPAPSIVPRLGTNALKLVIQRNAGLLLVAAAQAFFSMMNVGVKTLNAVDPPVPTMELIAVRMGITYICCISYMLAMGVPDPFLGPKGVRLLLVTRGSIGFFGLFGVYYSLQYLSLSDATVLTFLAPMCTAVAGSILLGESFTRREAFAGIVSIAGVVLIARPAALFGAAAHDEAAKGTPRDRLIAVGVALIGVLGATGAYISIRAIGKRAHPLHSMTFFSAFCVLISSTAMVVSKTQLVIPTRWDWLALLLMIGIFGFAAQTLLTMGLQRETAGRGTMGVYTQIIFAMILERVFFDALPSVLSVIGTLLIISSALYVALMQENGPAGLATRKGEQKPDSIGLQRRLVMEAELEEGLLHAHAHRGGVTEKNVEVEEDLEEEER